MIKLLESNKEIFFLVPTPTCVEIYASQTCQLKIESMYYKTKKNLKPHLVRNDKLSKTNNKQCSSILTCRLGFEEQVETKTPLL